MKIIKCLRFLFQKRHKRKVKTKNNVAKEEYLWANGVQNSTIEYLKECFEKLKMVSQSVHDTLNKLFLSYIVVGGMPQVVQTYINSHDIGKVIANQNEIIELYRLDIAKYAKTSEKMKIKAIYDSIPAQLNEKKSKIYIIIH